MPRRIAAPVHAARCVMQRACPLFVPLVEEGWLDHPVTRLVADEYLAELQLSRPRQPDPRLHALPAAGAAADRGAWARACSSIDSGAEAAAPPPSCWLARCCWRLRARDEPQHHFFLSDEPRRRSFARVAEVVPRPPAAARDRRGPDRPAVVRARRPRPWCHRRESMRDPQARRDPRPREPARTVERSAS